MSQASLQNLVKIDGLKPRKRSTKKSGTPEGKVKDGVKAILNEIPHCWYYMPVSNGMGRAGIPDFIACVNGYFVAIETKSIKSSHGVTKLQEIELRNIKRANGQALVINEDNIGSLAEWLNALGV